MREVGGWRTRKECMFKGVGERGREERRQNNVCVGEVMEGGGGGCRMSEGSWWAKEVGR